MRLIPIIPIIKKTVVPVIALRNKDLPDIYEFIDAPSFKQVINTILNVDNEGLFLSDLRLDLQDNQLVVYGNVNNNREVYCKLVCYFDYYDVEKNELEISFSIALEGSAVIATHVVDGTLFFDNVVSSAVERESRRM